MAQLLNPVHAFAADKLTRSQGNESQEHLVPVLAQVTINRKIAGSSSIVLTDHNNSWFISADTLSLARIRVPDGLVPVIHDDRRYFPLSAFEGAAARFDESLQALDLHFSPASFEPQVIRARQASERQPISAPAGMFVNYDLLISTGGVQNHQNLFTEWGAAIGAGVGLANIAWIRSDHSSRMVRLNTSYTVDDPERLATWRLGDAVSRPATSLGRPVRFGGLQYATNFQIQPGLVTMPVPTLNGQAALPSMVDLYVNNVLQSSSSIPPGPFSITTAPIIAGDGEVLVKVRDISGQEQLISGRIYASPALLAPGLSDFSFEAGSLRKNFGLDYDEYEGWFGSGSYRRGLTEQLTLEGGINAVRSGLRGALGSASFAIPGLGTGSIAAALSGGQGTPGHQYAVAFERRSGKMSLSFRAERADANYRQIGMDPALQTRSLDAAFGSYRFDGIGSLSVSYTRQERASGSETKLIGVSFSTQRSRMGSVIVSAYQSRNDDNNYSIGVFWILPVSGDWNASVSQVKTPGGPDATIFQAQKSPPYSEGFGWRLQTAINAAQQAALMAQNRYGMARLEAGSYQGQDSARLGWSGALANIDQQWYATRRIGGSYGLVHLPGLSDVRVYVDNQLVSRTDKNGYALLPHLHPYISNHVSLEPLDLPLDTKIDSLVTRPVPGWRSGTRVNFSVRKVTAATLRMVDHKGRTLPAGTQVSVNGGTASYAVGQDGMAYIEELSSENQITARWPGHQCRVSFSYVPSAELIPYLGEFECKQASE